MVQSELNRKNQEMTEVKSGTKEQNSLWADLLEQGWY